MARKNDDIEENAKEKSCAGYLLHSEVTGDLIGNHQEMENLKTGNQETGNHQEMENLKTGNQETGNHQEMENQEMENQKTGNQTEEPKTPEAKARVRIDAMLERAGWKVVDREGDNAMSVADGAEALREGLLKGSLEADYLLMVAGKVVGVLEAKRSDVNVNCSRVSDQAMRYTRMVPPYYACWARPLPLILLSNGHDLFRVREQLETDAPAAMKMYAKGKRGNVDLTDGIAEDGKENEGKRISDRIAEDGKENEGKRISDGIDEDGNDKGNEERKLNSPRNGAKEKGNGAQTVCRYERLNEMPRPKDVVRELGIKDEFAALPQLDPTGLRDCQVEAINHLEASFRAGQRRALIVLATGAGKTFTACMAIYRLLNYTTTVRRVLFLVDRNDLGRQAYNGFAQFDLTEGRRKFTDTYLVERLKSEFDKKENANVVISTIQRLFAYLSDKNVNDDEEEEDSLNNYTADDVECGDAQLNAGRQGAAGNTQPAKGNASAERDRNGKSAAADVALPPNPELPPDYFDLIVVDECHRSIYSNWGKVLTYFNTARIIGLTATPQEATVQFFGGNVVADYTLSQSVIDGVNVDSRVYRITTKASSEGGIIDEGEQYKQLSNRTGKTESLTALQKMSYTATELNRSVVNPAQIRLVLETYRQSIYTQLYPERRPDMDMIPKTLIFALDEDHAQRIVDIAREVFGHTAPGDPYVQRITYSAENPAQLIKDFRNEKNFRIAVTVTLVATGTDIKPLEVEIFMRDVESEILFTQMMGRGVRTINDDALRLVTTNATSKECFYLVDAVGVTEHTKPIPPIGNPQRKLPTLKELLEQITFGYLPDEYLKLLANRLSFFCNKADGNQLRKFEQLSGVAMKQLAQDLYVALEKSQLPPFVSVDDDNHLRKQLVKPLTLHPQAREYLLTIQAGFVTILQPGSDELIEAGFTQDDAVKVTGAFEAYLKEHGDELEALRLLDRQSDEPITYAALSELEAALLEADRSNFGTLNLWRSYGRLNADKVTPLNTGNADEVKALTNLIQLVRYAQGQTETLRSLYQSSSQHFNLWCGQMQRALTDEQQKLFRQVADYILMNGACVQVRQLSNLDGKLAMDLLRTSDMDRNHLEPELLSLSQFMLRAS
jgi:type I restriction enzyme R subunit